MLHCLTLRGLPGPSRAQIASAPAPVAAQRARGAAPRPVVAKAAAKAAVLAPSGRRVGAKAARSALIVCAAGKTTVVDAAVRPDARRGAE